NELEDWLSGITELQPADAAAAGSMPPQMRFAMMDMQRSLADLSEKVELRVLNDNTSDAVKDLAQGVDKLIRQMRAEQKVVREWADEQAQQQQELAAVLRQITDQSPVPAREEQG
ncbi:MAG: flagellar motor protein MotA, partial [Actinomycetota bacterium]